MSTQTYYDDYYFLADRERELKRLHNLSDLMWPKEKRNLLGFGLKDGMSVLEFASGPGFFTEKLSTLVPNGSITCVEPDASFIQHAHEYLKGRVKSRYEILETSGEDMELPEGSFDFVIARLVLQHLKDPLLVTRKLLRSLKPGGRLVITDFDIELQALTIPSFPEIMPIMGKTLQAQIQRGVDPASFRVGRRLWQILKEAGFTELDLDSVVFHSGDQGAGACFLQFAPTRMEPLVKAGVITEDELNVLNSTAKRFVSDPNSFYMRAALMACGTRP